MSSKRWIHWDWFWSKARKCKKKKEERKHRKANGKLKILQDSVKAASCFHEVPSLMQLATFFPLASQDSLEEFGELSTEFSPPGLEQCFPWTSSWRRCRLWVRCFVVVTRGASSFPLAQSQSTASYPTLERCAAAEGKKYLGWMYERQGENSWKLVSWDLPFKIHCKFLWDARFAHSFLNSAQPKCRHISHRPWSPGPKPSKHGKNFETIWCLWAIWGSDESKLVQKIHPCCRIFRLWNPLQVPLLLTISFAQ